VVSTDGGQSAVQPRTQGIRSFPAGAIKDPGNEVVCSYQNGKIMLIIIHSNFILVCESKTYGVDPGRNANNLSIISNIRSCHVISRCWRNQRAIIVLLDRSLIKQILLPSVEPKPQRVRQIVKKRAKFRKQKQNGIRFLKQRQIVQKIVRKGLWQHENGY
jgi:hypothetical protein